MGDISSDENESPVLLYRNKKEWNDVTPIPQDEGDEPVVAIDYTEKFKDVFDYFRAVVQSGEKSERALQLTKDAATLNPANYTVWQYRRDILKALDKDLHAELDYIGDIIAHRQPKNYQVWHHRRILVEWLQDPAKEKYLTEKVLASDAKNYHAWQHRQWVIKTFNLYEGELEYVDGLLEEDVRNNSAWNQRYFVIMGLTGFTETVIEREIDYTIEKLKLVTDNESSWNYLRGVLLHDKDGLSRNAKVTKFCEELYEKRPQTAFLLALIVDMCVEKIAEGNTDANYSLERAKQVCKDLAEKYDTSRAKYWEYMAETVEIKAQKEN